MNTVAHWVLLVPKIVIIKLIHWFHRVKAWVQTPESDLTQVSLPDFKTIEKEYTELAADAPDLWTGNPDHQVLRQAALLWATREQRHFDRFARLIKDNKFLRGIGSKAPDVAMPAICHAFALTVAQSTKEIKVSSQYQMDYWGATHELRDKDFEVGDTSTKCRWNSTGFDALFALAVMSHGASPIKKQQVLFTHGPLMIAPITYLKNRMFHLDYLGMMAAWTIHHWSADDRAISYAKMAGRHIWLQSRLQGNPHIAALAAEMHILTFEEIERVLKAHSNASPLEAIEPVSSKTYKMSPIDYTHYHNNEFAYDQVPKGQPVRLAGISGKSNLLDGLVLGRSLLVLHDEYRRLEG